MTDTGGYDEVVGALAEAYGRFTTATTDLAPRAWLRATGAEGWCVADLVAHQLADAQRALVTLHTPAGTPADTDR